MELKNFRPTPGFAKAFKSEEEFLQTVLDDLSSRTPRDIPDFDKDPQGFFVAAMTWQLWLSALRQIKERLETLQRAKSCEPQIPKPFQH